MEEIYVKDTYKIIAKHFDKTRYKKWNSIKDFLSTINKEDYIIEVGCGNGKNLIDLENPKLGIDFVEEFVEICNKKNIPTILGNNLNLPIKDNQSDITLSVAVIHHFSTNEKRLQAIKELIRITKPNGKIFISVWDINNPRFNISSQDNLIKWNFNNQIYYRYYYFFQHQELFNLISSFNVQILNSYSEKGNQIVIFSPLK